MQAVILAAGLGVRMGKLTQNTPKPLLRVLDKNLLEHKLNALPDDVKEVILVIGYKGDLIKQYFGSKYKNFKIRYVSDNTLSGTAHALWNAKNLIRDKFIVMMGDDIYDRESVTRAIKHDLAIVCKKGAYDETGGRIVLDESGNLIDFVTHKLYLETHQDGGLIFTGLYSLNKDIFKYEPVKLSTKEEWGLPQTVLKMAKDHGVKIIETDFWIQISTPEDLVRAEQIMGGQART